MSTDNDDHSGSNKEAATEDNVKKIYKTILNDKVKLFEVIGALKILRERLGYIMNIRVWASTVQSGCR